MRTTVARWGNSLALRLPRDAAADAGLVEGTEVSLRVEDDRLIVTPARPKYTLDELLAQMEEGHRHAETDWGAPAGKEAW